MTQDVAVHDAGTAPAAPSTEALDLGYTIATDSFSGPLDLLLFLVRRTEVDIFDIPLVMVIDQFVATVSAWQDMDLEVAGDFIAMAATLLEIKARLVAPPADNQEEGQEDDDLFDPRADLINALLAYRRFKEAALELTALEAAASGRCPRLYRETIPEDPDDTPDLELGEIDAHLLMRTCETILARINGLGPRTVPIDDMPLTVRINQLIEEMRELHRTTMRTLLARESATSARLGTVLATLECTRQRFLELKQVEQYGDVDLRWREDEERTRIPELPPEEVQPGGRRRRRPPLVTWTPPVRTGEAPAAEEEGPDAPEEIQETDEQRFLRELDEQCGLGVLDQTQDVEKSFLAHWYDLHPELKPPEPPAPEPPPPPPPVAETPAAPARRPKVKSPAKAEDTPPEGAPPAQEATAATAVVGVEIPSPTTCAELPAASSGTAASADAVAVAPVTATDPAAPLPIPEAAASAEPPPAGTDAIVPTEAQVAMAADVVPPATAEAPPVVEPAPVAEAVPIVPDPTGGTAAPAEAEPPVATVAVATPPAVPAPGTTDAVPIPITEAPVVEPAAAAPVTDAPPAIDVIPTGTMPEVQAIPAVEPPSASTPAALPEPEPEAASAAATPAVVETVVPEPEAIAAPTDATIPVEAAVTPDDAPASVAVIQDGPAPEAEAIAPSTAATTTMEDLPTPVEAPVAAMGMEDKAADDEDDEDDEDQPAWRQAGTDEIEELRSAPQSDIDEVNTALLAADDQPPPRFIEQAPAGLDDRGMSPAEYLAALDEPPPVPKASDSTAAQTPTPPVLEMAPVEAAIDPLAASAPETVAAVPGTEPAAILAPAAEESARQAITDLPLVETTDVEASGAPAGSAAAEAATLAETPPAEADTTASPEQEAPAEAEAIAEVPAVEPVAAVAVEPEAIPVEPTAAAPIAETPPAAADTSASPEQEAPAEANAIADVPAVEPVAAVAVEPEAIPVEPTAAAPLGEATPVTAAPSAEREQDASTVSDSHLPVPAPEAVKSEAIAVEPTATAPVVETVPVMADSVVSAEPETPTDIPMPAARPVEAEATSIEPTATPPVTGTDPVVADPVAGHVLETPGDGDGTADMPAVDTQAAVVVEAIEPTAIPELESPADGDGIIDDAPAVEAVAVVEAAIVATAPETPTMDGPAPSHAEAVAPGQPVGTVTAGTADGSVAVATPDQLPEASAAPGPTACVPAPEPGPAALDAAASAAAPVLPPTAPEERLYVVIKDSLHLTPDVPPVPAPLPEATATPPPDPGPPPPPVIAIPPATPTTDPDPDDVTYLQKFRLWRIAAILVAALLLIGVVLVARFWLPRSVLEVTGAPLADHPLEGRAALEWHFNLDVLPEHGAVARLPEPVISPRIDGAWSWSDRRTLVFTPANDWPPATTFQVRLAKGQLASAAGFVLGSDLASTVRSPALAVQGCRVVTFAEDGSSTIEVAFNHAVDPSALARALHVEQDGKGLTATAVAGPAQRSISLHIAGNGPVAVGLAKDFTGVTGDLGLQEPWTMPLTLGPTLRATGATGQVPGHGPASLRVIGVGTDLSLLAEALTIEPAIPYRIVLHEGSVELVGDFQPATTYRVAITARWPGAVPTHPLEAYPMAQTLEVAMPHRDAAVWVGNDPQRPTDLTVTAVNTRALTISVLADGERTVASCPLSLPGDAAEDRPRERMVDVQELLQDLPAGSYQLRIGDGEASALATVDKLVVPPGRILAALREWQDARPLARNGIWTPRLCVVAPAR